MRLDQALKHVEFHGLGQAADFKIKTSSLMMTLLSDNIYTDSIAALIRETAGNAWDSHVKKGNPQVPFDIHLPVLLEPYYIIRDYGVGLSKDDMFNIYTTYGESDPDKINSDDYLGCMGLGSKSPLAYVKHFMVNSYFGGMKYSFLCSKNEKNVPCLFFLEEEKTEEDSGLEITIQVKEKDFPAFYNKAASIFSLFNPKPKINIKNFNFNNEVEPKFELENIKFFDRSHRGRNNHSVISGCIRYKLNMDEVSKKLSDIIKNSLFEDFNLEITCGIGEVDFDVARENVRFTDKTYDSLRKFFSNFRNAISNFIIEKTKNIESLWERSVYLTDHILNQIYNSFKFDSKLDLFKNSEIISSIQIDEKLDVGKLRNKSYRSYRYQVKWRGYSYDRHEHKNIKVDKNVRFIFIENQRGYLDRILTLKNIDNKSFPSIEQFIIFRNWPEEEKVKFIEKYGLTKDTHYFLYSELYEKHFYVEKQKISKVNPLTEYKKNKFLVKSFKDFQYLNGNDKKTNYFDIDQINDMKISFYVPYVRNKVVSESKYDKIDYELIKDQFPFFKSVLKIDDNANIICLRNSEIKLAAKLKIPNFWNYLDNNINLIVNGLFEKKNDIKPKYHSPIIFEFMKNDWLRKIELIISIFLENNLPLVKELEVFSKKEDFSLNDQNHLSFFSHLANILRECKLITKEQQETLTSPVYLDTTELFESKKELEEKYLFVKFCNNIIIQQCSQLKNELLTLIKLEVFGENK